MKIRKIRTEAELKHYLTKRYWDCLIITEPIILTEPVFIERAVEIRCSGMGMIHFDLFDTAYEFGAFVVKSQDVTFQDAKIIGLFYLGYDRHQSGIIFSNGIGSCRVTNCLIEGFNYANIWQRDCDLLLITDKTKLVGTGAKEGHNYGAWIGGVTDRPEMVMHAIDCSFEESRHAIGAHYGPNSYYAYGNRVKSTKHSFDRHNWNDGGRKGGLHTHIIGNTFLDPDRLAFSIEPPYDGGSFSFIGNTLNHSKERWIGEVSDERVWEKQDGWYNAQGNKFKMI